MPLIPFFLKTLFMTLGSGLAKLLMKWAMKLVQGKALEELTISALEYVAQRTDTKIDDKIVKLIKEECEKEEEPKEEKE